jgi:hypothetical protein
MKPPGPSSDAFWILCWGYRDAGDATLAVIRSEAYTGFAVLPCVFLYFRCVELALKTVLVHHGVPELEITRTLDHRISALLARAEKFSPLTRLGISAQDRQLLERYSDDYSDKWFEYPEDVFVNYPTLEELRDLAGRVCDAIGVYKPVRSS